MDIPSHWLVLTRQELKDNPDLFDLEKADFGNVDRNLMQNVLQQVRSGRVEMYFNKITSDNQFADNINVMKNIGSFPKNENELPSLQQLSSLFSKHFGRQINVYNRGLRKVNGLQSMYIDFDGVVSGTRSIQYTIQKSENVQITITATCKMSVLDTIRKEFDDMVHSIIMN